MSLSLTKAKISGHVTLSVCAVLAAGVVVGMLIGKLYFPETPDGYNKFMSCVAMFGLTAVMIGLTEPQ